LSKNIPENYELSYERFLDVVATAKAAVGSIDSGTAAESLYVLTGHHAFAQHAVKIFYADRKSFTDMRTAVIAFLSNLEAFGFEPSNNHLLAALVCCTKDNIKAFRNWMNDRLLSLPVDRVRFACRVMKRERTMDFLIDVLLSQIHRQAVLPSHLFMLDQYLAGFLPEQRVDARLAVQARVRELGSERRFKGYESEVLVRLQRRAALTGEVELPPEAVVDIVNILRSPPKVAVCISGQLRGYRAAYARMQPFLDELKPDKYVHTWSDIGRGMLVPDRANRWFEGEILKEFRTLCMENKISGRTFLDRFPAFANEEKLVEVNEIQDFYGATKAVVENDIAMESNHHRMFYKIWSCHSLLLDSRKDYDVVIRIRPDLVFEADASGWAAILHRVQHQKVVFAETEFGVNRRDGWVGDQFAVGSSEAMTRYASVYPLSLQAAPGSLATPIVHAHETLGRHMWSGGYFMPRAPIQNAKLTEVSLISADVFLQKLESGTRDDVYKRLAHAAKKDLKALS
jgi:hypothetical protein